MGVYANFAAVSSQSPHDVTLDFIQLVPGGGIPMPIVVSRVKVAATFLMPLMQLLSSHSLTHEQLSREAEAPPPAQEKDS